MGNLKALAQAKINLSLKVVGRRKDGFHEIDTLMVPVSLADTLTLRPSNAQGIRLVCSEKNLPMDENNLVVKALLRFQEHFGLPLSLEVELEKNIPSGAGLGGGSSDAAAALVLANTFYQQPFQPEKICQIAAELGSDIPFFCQQSAARCLGRGEVVQAIPNQPDFTVLLIKPPFGVASAFAYQRWAVSRKLPGVCYEPQEYAKISFYNDLEQPVFEKYIFLAHLKMWLLEQAETKIALMSGSGSTLFVVVESQADAAQLSQRVRAEFGTTLWQKICRTGKIFTP